MIDIWDHETNAREIYRQADVDPGEPPGPHALAHALMGRGWLCYLPRIANAIGFYSPAGARERIYVRRGLTAKLEAWIVFHELAERHLYSSDDPLKERACDQLAACLRAPREAFRFLISRYGMNLPRLAKAIVCSQTSAAMRYGETTGTPVAVLTPTTVHVRGDAFEWPDEISLRRAVASRRLPRAVRRVRLRDAPNRVAIVAA